MGRVQWQYKTFYLYGVIEPQSGESLFFEFSHLDTICFEKFLELFSQAYPEDFHIIQVDNGSFHSSLQLHIPDNIILLFQPSHSPQVNPIERQGEEIKEQLSWELFDNLQALRVAVEEILAKLSPQSDCFCDGMGFYS